MCGIAGYFGRLDESKGAHLVKEMTDSLSHRGPDGEGQWIKGNVGLGHRRLAIIDLESGVQPMSSVDGRYVITYNGEIYNYQDLRQQLQEAGYSFRTNSDTEVIPLLIDHLGVSAGLRALRGMFALAIYDTLSEELLLARDPVGIKPLYYSSGSSIFTFGSEPKAVLCARPSEIKVDPRGLLDFLTLGHSFAPHTCFLHIKELQPGSWMRVTLDGIQVEKYWEWPDHQDSTVAELDSGLDAVRRVLSDSVAAHTVSDVPIAGILSGGIDSSVIVALLSKQMEGKLKTFTVSFDEAGYDESAYARAVAERSGTDHHEIHIGSGTGTVELFCQIVSQYDLPFGDSSCIPTYLLSQAIADKTKVALSGDGGDEMFGGYERYLNAKRLGRITDYPGLSSLITMVGNSLSFLRPEMGRRVRKAGEFASMETPAMLTALRTYFSTSDLASLLTPDYFRTVSSIQPTSSRFMEPASPRLETTEQLMIADIYNSLHGDYLRKIDTASMAHGLEIRVPFLDQKVFELSSQLAMNLKVRDGELKYLLRKLAYEVMPSEAIDRKKQGFGIPLDRWFTPEILGYFEDLLLSSDARILGIVRRERLQEMFSALRGDFSPREISRYQVYQRIFMMFSLGLWLETQRISV